jgi:2-polyprenyl-3-methyl-5-hydroxy-6-metoxy-1,4-benzoquinol methylase/uncharacterized protein YbaR (Trm112 family)
MNRKILDKLIDPKSGKRLSILNLESNNSEEILTGLLIPKGEKYYYPIINGIPRLLIGYKNDVFNKEFSSQINKYIKDKISGKISKSERKNISIFSIHWLNINSLDLNGFSVWGVSGKQIVRDVLRIFNMKPKSWGGKWVLDAGCGNGIAAIGLSRSGAEIVAMDITEGVDRCKLFCSKNNINYKDIHFIQASVEHPPFKKKVFDAIYTNGVLHHTPSTRRSFIELTKTLKIGGKFYLWVYIKPRDLYSKTVYSINTIIRKLLKPFGERGVYLFSRFWVYPMRGYHHLRKIIGLGDPFYLKLSKRSHILVIYDHFAIAYDWHHTYEEVFGWFEECGFFYRSIPGIGTTLDLDYKTHYVSVVGIKQD